jgi:outer membrane protein OmpA-like peptidoglycan-associated protein
MGLLMCELLDNYAGALPYLEKACKLSGKDTLGDLLYAMAKCYHHNGEYEKAISYFDRMKSFEDYDEEIEFQKDIAKRREDCNYAIAHKNYTPPANWYIVNAGKNINSDMPEYVPVLTPQNELIFTSRRRDDVREQVSYLDGKYFESMYISQVENGRFKEPRRYTLPDQIKSHFLKNHESVVSMSPDGKKLFTYKDNKIFEINMDNRVNEKPKKLLKTINFDYYQNHAFLTKDGNTLYFTSEAKGGVGGIDIYRSNKIKEGEWSKPENIGAPVNTEFDEDAPFVTDDGKTLYFASTGHEGFGNFDIYRSELVDGKWGAPVNLGQPINSPANDIFMIQDSKASVGFFSSARIGGYGDMDIYKIVYLDNFNKDCPGTNIATNGINLSISDADTTDFKNKVEVTMPSNYKILNYEWKVNDVKVENQSLTLEYDYKQTGTYSVFSKVIAYCDTCFAPVIACNLVENKFVTPKADTASTITTPVVAVDLNKVKGELNSDQLKSLGFNVNPILFDFNKSDIRSDADEIIKTNNEILKKYPGLTLEIIGYTDSRGSAAYNKALSERRAASVKKHIANGLKRTQIKFSTGKGITDPVVDCVGKDCDESSHQQNRRVIFKVYSK